MLHKLVVFVKLNNSIFYILSSAFIFKVTQSYFQKSHNWQLLQSQSNSLQLPFQVIWKRYLISNFLYKHNF